jgi:hypothetical protein
LADEATAAAAPLALLPEAEAVAEAGPDMEVEEEDEFEPPTTASDATPFEMVE